jgi:hypothetical protein
VERFATLNDFVIPSTFIKFFPPFLSQRKIISP